MIRIVSLLLLATTALTAQIPSEGLRTWWRADRGVTTDNGALVSSWTSADGGAAAAVATEQARPTLVANAVNGHPVVRFNGSSTYLDGPQTFPVDTDYTLYIVARIGSLPGANNMLSGDRRAFWLNSADRPRVLHAADFGQQAVSDVGMFTDRFSVVRVSFRRSTSTVSMFVNNMRGAIDAPVPVNDDPKIYIGAFQRGNVFNGDIAEILVYGRTLTPDEITRVDTTLHRRYAIPRALDPRPPSVVFDRVPKPLALVPMGQPLRCQGAVVDPSVRRVVMTLDSSTVPSTHTATWERATSPDSTFSVTWPLEVGLHTYRCIVTITFDDGRVDTIVNAPDIVCGEVIAVNGQSNSIWPDPTLTPSPWARTFGSNAGSSASDTAFYRSVTQGAGGGPNVGAWGAYLQGRIAEDLGIPTCVINGGVGGTRIEQHFPDPVNRTNLGTIYGSWLYRLRLSGLASHVRWLFWYQGESNAGSDRYDELFATLYRAWHEDLPNLERIVVIQIRPGCGGADHALLRDAQRRLEDMYPDVYVHAAAGLPGHDGCHYQPVGYQTLGEQLYRIHKMARLSMGPMFPGTAPRLDRAEVVLQQDRVPEVHVHMRRGNGLHMTSDTMVDGGMRRATDAFFFDRDPSARPRSVTVRGDTLILMVGDGPVPTSVSYVPDTHYPGTTTVYQGPWLVNVDGVGALTFHDVPLTAVGVQDVKEGIVGDARVVHVGDRIPETSGVDRILFHQQCGALVGTAPVIDGSFIVPSVPPGIYVMRGRRGVVMVLP